MHKIQKDILKIVKKQDILKLGLRPLGRLIGVNSPQQVKHHLNQLLKKGLIKSQSRDNIKQFLEHSATKQPSLIKIPVLGAANCGIPTIIAEESIEKYINVSQSLLRRIGNIFALVAKGNSLNKASIGGNKVEEDDYIIVDKDQRNPSPGDYILSIIDNCANVKKFAYTKDGNIALLSESTSKHTPIYINKNDNFIVNGKVIQIIKTVKKE